MVILDDRAFADQIEEVLDVNFLELNYLKCFLNKVFNYRKKYEVHPSRDIMKTILRSELDNENELNDIFFTGIINSVVKKYKRHFQNYPLTINY